MITASTATQQQKKRSKPPDRRAARKRYWASRHLEKTKVRHMMKAYGLTRKKAEIRWNAERQTRVPAGFLHDYTDGKADTHKKRGVA